MDLAAWTSVNSVFRIDDMLRSSGSPFLRFAEFHSAFRNPHFALGTFPRAFVRCWRMKPQVDIGNTVPYRAETSS
jgi:hypothetical protein